MSTAFTISATFLTGRYHGEEWPPSPARLMQSLVAAAKSGGQRQHWERVQEGLRWLEQQAAPRIRACNSAFLTPYRLAVPNNDLDSAAKDWLAGRWSDTSSLKSMKSVEPRLLDDGSPHVEYEWTFEDNKDNIQFAERLIPAVRSLYCLGWGVDMACADIRIGLGRTERRGWKTWVPASQGLIYKVPAPGFLEDLEATFHRYLLRSVGAGVDANTRPMAYREQRYRKVGSNRPPFATFGLRTPDGEGIFSRHWSSAMEISAWMRHSAGALLAGSVDERILKDQIYGHTENTAEANLRMSYVPLPSIHQEYGDGRIRRVMIVGPRGADGELVRQLKMKWKAASLRSEEKEECVMIPLPDMMTELYTGQSTCWRSVTPIILHGHNELRSVISISKTEKLLLRAFDMAGVPLEIIKSLAFQPAPFWMGTGSANRIRIPKHLEDYPRYHVEVRFRESLEGPLLAGIGRHCGLGLFANAPPPTV